MVAYLHPGFPAVSEFARQVALGAIKLPDVPQPTNIVPGSYLHGTCVETAAYEIAVATARIPWLPASEVGDYLQAMVNEWRAANPNVGTSGASSYWDATNWLRGIGLTVDADVATDADAAWAEMQANIPKGYLYLIGTCNAQALPGDEPGVHCHGLSGGGIDGSGNIICGDPDNSRTQVNMTGSPYGGLVSYTLANFQAAGITSLTRVHPVTQVPAGWSDNGSELVAPNGHKVVLGFRNHVLNYIGGWFSDNWPLEDEQESVELEPRSNPGLGRGNRQTFRGAQGPARLEYRTDPNPPTGVFEGWAGQELLADEADIAKGTGPIIDVAGIAADLNAATAALNSVDSAITDAHKKLGA